LYSNPLNLVFSIQRVFSPDVDPDAVEPMLEDFFSAPVAIEKMVLQKIPYHYDWEVYGMLWYFPTVEQVLERGNGLLLAWLSESYACGEEGSLPLWFIGSGGSQDYLMQKRSVQ
jgi:hypothetical protein